MAVAVPTGSRLSTTVPVNQGQAWAVRSDQSRGPIYVTSDDCPAKVGITVPGNWTRREGAWRKLPDLCWLPDSHLEWCRQAILQKLFASTGQPVLACQRGSPSAVVTQPPLPAYRALFCSLNTILVRLVACRPLMPGEVPSKPHGPRPSGALLSGPS